MAISTETGEYRDLPVVAVKGRIVDVDVKKFSKKLKSLTHTTQQAAIVDLSEVTFIDSYGLGILVYYANAMEKEGKKLIVCNTNKDPQAYLRRLFDVTNLDKVLTIVSSPKEITLT